MSELQNIDLKELESFLDSADIPTIEKAPKTFLGIAKQPHYDNVLSNIYAFYFNPFEEHGLKDLFIRSFEQVVGRTNLGKKKKLQFTQEFEIHTEYKTLKNGRIDLLLMNESNAFIIENKVYHILNNDLQDYWDSVELADDSKIGVLLTLKKLAHDKKDLFVNITHLSFLKAVMKNAGPYLLEANDKYVVFLTDLFQNIINLSNPMDIEKVEFYLKNQNQLDAAYNLKLEVIKYLKSEVEKVPNLLNEKLNLYTPKSGSYNESRLRYYTSHYFPNLMFTIIFDGLFDSKKELDVYIELNNKDIKLCQGIDKSVFTDEENKLRVKEFDNNKNTWAHFAHKRFVLNNSELTDLSSFINKEIVDSNLMSIFLKLKNHLKNHYGKEVDKIDFM